MREQLRALALAATKSHWLKEGHTIYALVHFGWRNGVEQFKNRFWASVYKDVECPEEERQANVDFIAAANPVAILALLDELADHERAYALLFKENAELRKDAERLDYLQNNARCDPKMDGNHVWWPTSFNQAQGLKGPTIRAAIDAAKGESND
jgi:hypothetical protein